MLFVFGGLLILGMIALLFTPYRYVVGYFIAGMVYWLIIEGIQRLLVFSFSIPLLYGYMIAIMLTFALFIAIYIKMKKSVAHKPNVNNHSVADTYKQAEKTETYNQQVIRHRSVLDYEKTNR